MTDTELVEKLRELATRPVYNSLDLVKIRKDLRAIAQSIEDRHVNS